MKSQETASPTETPRLALIARNSTNLTQEKFAKTLGIPLTTVRNWEQGVSNPINASEILLRLIIRFPELVMDLIAQVDTKKTP